MRPVRLILRVRNHSVMNAFLFVLLLAAGGAGAYHLYIRDYLHDHPISRMQGYASAKSTGAAGSAPAAEKDFKELDARLQTEMNHIPVSLRDARQMPATTLDTRSRTSPYLALYEEYITLSQACDVIIEADQNFAEHQQKCGFAPAPAGASAQERARAASAAGPAVYQQQQTIWNSQRKLSDGKLRQLLATLDTRPL